MAADAEAREPEWTLWRQSQACLNATHNLAAAAIWIQQHISKSYDRIIKDE